MPESPEMQALADQLGARFSGRVLEDADVLEFRAVKTRAAPPSTLVGSAVTGVGRHGKHLEIVFGGRRLATAGRACSRPARQRPRTARLPSPCCPSTTGPRSR